MIARPTSAPTFSTPSIERSSRLARSIRFISGRGAGAPLPADEELPLLERRWQRVPEERDRRDAGNDDRTRGEVDDPRAAPRSNRAPGQRPASQATTGDSPRPRPWTSRRLSAGVSERHDHRWRRARRGSDDDRREEAPAMPSRKRRDDRHGNDQRSVQRGSSHLERRVEDDGRREEHRSAGAHAAAGDVLGADDRLVATRTRAATSPAGPARSSSLRVRTGRGFRRRGRAKCSRGPPERAATRTRSRRQAGRAAPRIAASVTLSIDSSMYDAGR